MFRIENTGKLLSDKTDTADSTDSSKTGLSANEEAVLRSGLTGETEKSDVIKGLGIEKHSEPAAAAEQDQSAKEVKKLKDMWSPVAKGVSDKFYEEIVAIAKRVNCDPVYLSIVLYQESKFNPRAKNGSFRGIGQMSHVTLADSLQNVKRKNLDIEVNTSMSLNRFAQLSREKQLPYIEAYIMNAKRIAGMSANEKIESGKLYALFFLPGYADKPVLASKFNPKTAKYYRSNRPFDMNNDGKITPAELKKFLDDRADVWGITLPDDKTS